MPPPGIGQRWPITRLRRTSGCYLGHVYTADHNAFNSTPRAVLNVCRDSMARCGLSPPTRVFEAAGAGACLITDDWEGVENFLEPGAECLVARDGVEVGAIIEELDTAEAARIGVGALKRVRAEHTYDQRAAERFTLNLTRADMIEAGYSPSVRLFEAAACGCPILSDWWEGLDQFFKVGEEVLVVDSSAQVSDYLINLSADQRRRLGAKARARVLAAHTATHRAAELESYALELLGRRPPAQAAARASTAAVE